MGVKKIVILGGGIAGISAALSLTKLIRSRPDMDINVTVYEVRATPSTIGGAINLTPNALRYLEHLNVLPKLQSKGCPVAGIQVFSLRTGVELGLLSFTGKGVSHGAMRVQRAELLKAMLETAEHVGLDIRYGKKATRIELLEGGTTTYFEDGEIVTGDLLLGCDGIHSLVRSFIEPEREPIYSGIATAYGFLDDDGTMRSELPIKTTGVWSGRTGSMLMSWTDPARTRLYVAAVMETPEVASREGWRVKGADVEAVKADVIERLRSKSVPYIKTSIQSVESFFLYPVYKLPPYGKWSSGCALLLGDAAHAMPPQGESTGLAIEDTILFTRVFEHLYDRPVAAIFERYEQLRRARIDHAYEEATFRWESTRDKGWLATVAMEWMSVLYLWWMQDTKTKEFAYDVREIGLDAI